MQSIPNRDPERAYDAIGVTYETSCPDYTTHLQDVLTKVTDDLVPGSKVLDIGCGTGKPAAFHFVNKGHDVIGIDISQKMVDVASSQVPEAKFFKADMTAFQPPEAGNYDAVIASHSLYYLSLGQLRMMIYRFSHWVKQGGIVLVGSSLKAEAIEQQTLKFDRRGWAEGVEGSFLGHKFDYTYGLVDAWRVLLQDAGLEVIDVDQRHCTPVGSDKKDSHIAFFMTTRKIVDNALLGPHPVPRVLPDPLSLEYIDSSVSADFEQRIARKEISAIVDLVKNGGYKKVLVIGSGAQGI